MGVNVIDGEVNTSSESNDDMLYNVSDNNGNNIIEEYEYALYNEIN
jgi:hypothetical protein